MSDIRVTRANERRKAIGGVLTQLGTALLAAAVVKAYYGALYDLEVLGWLAGAIFLIWMGWLTLGLLQDEES